MNNHYMIDVETTGTNPQQTSMIQLAAVAFNPDKGTISGDLFSRSLFEMPGRFWERGTQKFWDDKKPILNRIQAGAIEPKTAMRDFFNWVLKHNQGAEPIFWSKPTTFDWCFVDEYFTRTDVSSPFSFRSVIDMRSWLRAKLGTLSLDDIVKFEKSLEFQGDAHDARFDALHQVRIVMKAAGHNT